MKSIYESCGALPDTDRLGHVQMRNSSTPLDYDKISEHMAAGKDEITERARVMLARVGQNTRD